MTQVNEASWPVGSKGVTAGKAEKLPHGVWVRPNYRHLPTATAGGGLGLFAGLGGGCGVFVNLQ